MEKQFFLAMLIVFALSSARAMGAVAVPDSMRITIPHPRLMAGNDMKDVIDSKIAADPFLFAAHESIIRQSEKMLDAPTLHFEKIGKRLLAVSREALKEIWYLSYSYRMTGNRLFADKALQVMRDVCAFDTWNPSHYLDVAEMTAAVSIGYDWLFDAIDAETKAVARDAIMKKGLEMCLPGTLRNPADTSWRNRRNNWNAVCNMGMAAGAVAIYEDNPELCRSILANCVNNATSHTLQEYQPDGNYPEGYSYWSYGTCFLIMLQEIVEKATGVSMGLERDPGFMASGAYIRDMTTKGLDYFSYSDSKPGKVNLHCALFWMAAHGADRSLLYREKELVDDRMASGNMHALFNARYVPALLLWAREGALDSYAQKPSARLFVGQGDTPVAIMRNHWGGDDELYLVLKGGSAQSGHAHMDAGSFAMGYGSEIWFSDLGSQDYYSLEKEGINLNDRSQGGDRWKAFRNGPFSHNIVMFDGALQDVGARVTIDSCGDEGGRVFASSDLTPLNRALVKRHVRTASILDGEQALIVDYIVAGESSVSCRWAALTCADVSIRGKRKAVLEMGGKRLLVRVAGRGVRLETYSTVPPNAYDEANPGSMMLGFTTTIPGNSRRTFKIRLIQDSSM